MSFDELRECRGCGCDDDHACPGGCSWTLLDVDEPSGICSRCAEELGFDPLLMMTMNRDVRGKLDVDTTRALAASGLTWRLGDAAV